MVHCFQLLSSAIGIVISNVLEFTVFLQCFAVYPVLLETPKNITVRVGNTFELHCKAKGYPVPKISWKKDGGKSFPAADERRMDLLPNKVYVVRNATSFDGGKYTCNASNDAGFVNSSAFVTVLGKENIVSFQG